MMQTVERGAQDEERPALAHGLERGSDRALPQQFTMSFEVQHDVRSYALSPE
jgi:hypothetical protein